MVPPLGYKVWKVNEVEQTLDLYLSTKYGMQRIAIIEQMGDSTFECHLQKQRCAYTTEVMHGTVEEVQKKIENDIIQSFKDELKRLKRSVVVYEDFIAVFTGKEAESKNESMESTRNKLERNRKTIRLFKRKHKSDQEYIRLLEKRMKLYE